MVSKDDFVNAVAPSIKRAKLQFKYAVTLRESYRGARNHPQLVILKSISRYSRNAKGNLAGFSDENWKSLNKADEKRAAVIIERQAIYMIAVYIFQAFDNFFTKKNFRMLGKSKNLIQDGLGRFKNSENEKEIKGIMNIIDVLRLTRNAFAHDPFCPKWLLDHKESVKHIVIDGKTEFDFEFLKGKTLEMGHFDGALGPVYLLDSLFKKLNVFRSGREVDKLVG